jgi:hypothetical protein
MIDDEGAWTPGGFNLATQVRHQGNLDTNGTGLEGTKETIWECRAGKSVDAATSFFPASTTVNRLSAGVDGAWHGLTDRNKACFNGEAIRVGTALGTHRQAC